MKQVLEIEVPDGKKAVWKDGGNTFCGVAEAFEKVRVSKDKLNISVIHMVNVKGIENLSKHFNHVWFTNSYKDWDNLPDNVTLINLI